MNDLSNPPFDPTFIEGLSRVQSGRYYSWAHWMDYQNGEVYIRIFPQTVDGERTLLVDIANVSWPLEHQRKGHLTALIRELRTDHTPAYAR